MYGYHVGILLQATDKLSFGVRYLSRQKIEIDDGNASFSQINTGIVLPNANPLGLPAGSSAGRGSWRRSFSLAVAL